MWPIKTKYDPLRSGMATKEYGQSPINVLGKTYGRQDRLEPLVKKTYHDLLAPSCLGFRTYTSLSAITSLYPYMSTQRLIIL